MEDTVFIYKKGKLIKVLDINESKLYHNDLLTEGFKHIVTLKPSIWLELILNLEINDIENEIFELLNN